MAYLIGIAGGSSSGKTSFITRLKEHFNESELTVLSQDHYYKEIQHQIQDEHGEINFDKPESIDEGKFLNDLHALENGIDIRIKEYVFNNPKKTPQVFTLKAADVIIVEGLFIFENKHISDKLDLKLFIDAQEDFKFSRRIKRDVEERGLTEDLIEYQWNNHVKPSYEKYILPHKDKVDMVIMNNTSFEIGITVVSNHLKIVMSSQKSS